ncbi:MAG TPA: hypothetical protein VL134_08060 [Leptolyngbya sp.]|nr:hypothetical protein [Leptolyngbya sp.]
MRFIGYGKHQSNLCHGFASIIELYIVKGQAELYSGEVATVEGSTTLRMMGDPRRSFRLRWLSSADYGESKCRSR